MLILFMFFEMLYEHRVVLEEKSESNICLASTLWQVSAVEGGHLA